MASNGHGPPPNYNYARTDREWILDIPTELVCTDIITWSVDHHPKTPIYQTYLWNLSVILSLEVQGSQAWSNSSSYRSTQSEPSSEYSSLRDKILLMADNEITFINVQLQG